MCTKSIPPNLRPRSTSSFCTTQSSCTAQICGRGLRNVKTDRKPKGPPENCIGKRVPVGLGQGCGGRRSDGGGRAHPKRPQDWSYRLPKKALRLATRMALAARIADNEVVLIDELKFEQPKTKEAATILKNLGLHDQRLLVTLENYDVTAYKSLRNIDKVDTLPVSDLNAYVILRPKKVLMTRAALDMFRAKVVGTAG